MCGGCREKQNTGRKLTEIHSKNIDKSEELKS